MIHQELFRLYQQQLVVLNEFLFFKFSNSVKTWSDESNGGGVITILISPNVCFCL